MRPSRRWTSLLAVAVTTGLVLSACADAATPAPGRVASSPTASPPTTRGDGTPSRTPTPGDGTGTGRPDDGEPPDDDQPTPGARTVADLDDDEATALAEQVNALGFDLHRGLWERDPATVVTSPLSASVLLAMLAAGAEGTTGEQFVDVLGLDGTRDDRYAALLARVLDTEDVDVSTANALWTAVPLRDDYVDVVEDTFGATAQQADLGDQAAADAIDAWVRDTTRDRIDGIARDLGLPDAGVVTVLANALYLDAAWTTSFDPARTTDQPFTLPSGEEVDVPLMRGDAGMEVEYVSRPVADVVRLPYGTEGRFAMEVFLPGGDGDLSSFMADFDAERWTALTRGLTPRSDVDVALPTFELEWADAIDPVLQELGLVDAYRGGFGAMVDGGGVFLDTVVQKTVVRVDESGTEAAAVTGGAQISSVPPAVRVDRPFAFTVSDRTTGAILFLGTVTDPRG